MSKNYLNLLDHIAIIMDGNGRWATKRGLPRNVGHKAGVKAIEKTIHFFSFVDLPLLRKSWFVKNDN